METDLIEKVSNAYYLDTDKAFQWITDAFRVRSIDDLHDNPLPALEAKLSNAVNKCIKRDTVFRQKVERVVDEFHLRGQRQRWRSRQIIWMMG